MNGVQATVPCVVESRGAKLAKVSRLAIFISLNVVVLCTYTTARKKLKGHKLSQLNIFSLFSGIVAISYILLSLLHLLLSTMINWISVISMYVHMQYIFTYISQVVYQPSSLCMCTTYLCELCNVHFTYQSEFLLCFNY